MSGSLQTRVNREWLDVTNPGNSNNWIFSEVMHFFEDHPGIDVISYGEGKVESGTSLPGSWLAWEGDYTQACPWGDNAWFVVEAQNASADLSGDGSRQWQAKFQVANTGAFDDCNVADVDYGFEGTNDIGCVRFSPDGGWVGSGTLDFVAVTASDNKELSFDSGSNVPAGLHFFGDDDTVCAYGYHGTRVPIARMCRPLYMGEIVRRTGTAVITKPELLIAPQWRNSNESASFPSVGRVDSQYMFWHESEAVSSFSLAADGSGVTSHLLNGQYGGSTGFGRVQEFTAHDPWSSDPEILSVLVRQYDGEHQSVLGQLRFWAMINQAVAEGSLLPDGEHLSVGHQTATYSGVAIPWPGSATSPVFP